MITQNFMPKYTQENKENKLFNAILKLFVEHFDTLNHAVEQIRYCKKHYYSERDYNIAQSAMIYLSNPDIIQTFASSGYYDIDRYAWHYIWFMWLNAIRDVANYILNEHESLAKIAWK